MKKVVWVRITIFVMMALLILLMVLAKPGQPSDSPTQPVATEPLTEPPTEPTEETQPVTVPAWAETVSQQALTAQQYFVWEVGGGFLTASHDPETRIFPASITKLMTALVALEYLQPDTYVTAGNEMDGLDPESSIAWIQTGDTLTVRQLVEAMLLPSGNDASCVIAVAAGRKILGDEFADGTYAASAFVERMNSRALELGMTGSHFENPHGLHSEDHYMTIRDLVLLGELCLENEMVCHYATLALGDNPRYNENDTDPYAPQQWKNTNALVQPDSPYYCPEALGLKTGNTGAAGSCLLSAFRFGRREYVVGVFKCSWGESRFADTLNLLAQALNIPLS